MTTFADGIESGTYGLTSAQATRAHTTLRRYRRFVNGGNQTWTGFFPYGAIGLTASLHINSQGSATTSDRITITASAGSTTLWTISSMGSANGILGTATVAGLGTVTPIVSACAVLGPNVEGSDVPFQVILSSVDTATDYSLFLNFIRPFRPST